MNILAIGAHPDDIELGCGGTLIKAAQLGHNIFMYVLTRGEASGDPVERTKEAMAAAAFIGARTLWVDNFEDANLTVCRELVSRIEYFIDQSKADLVLTHSENDYHHDHRAAAEATLEAGRYSRNIVAYEIPVTKRFSPGGYYDISDVIEKKTELIRLFESQRDKLFTNEKAIRGLSNYRAFQSRLSTHLDAVESFEVVRICFSPNFELMKREREPTGPILSRPMDLSALVTYVPKGLTARNAPADQSSAEFLEDIIEGS